VVDGVEGKECPNVTLPIFSPDSKHVAYAACRDNKWLPVVDGVEGEQSTPYASFVFSPDLARQAYILPASNEGGCVVVDGVKGKTYKAFVEIVFSPDGKHAAYIAKSADRWAVVIDGNEFGAYDGVFDHRKLTKSIIPNPFEKPDVDFTFLRWDSTTKCHVMMVTKKEVSLAEFEIEE